MNIWEDVVGDYIGTQSGCGSTICVHKILKAFSFGLAWGRSLEEHQKLKVFPRRRLASIHSTSMTSSPDGSVKGWACFG